MRAWPLVATTLLVAFPGCRSLDPITRPDTEINEHADLDATESYADATGDHTDHADLSDPRTDDGGKDAIDAKETGVDLGPDTQGVAVPRSCDIVFQYKADGPVASVTVPGEWNSWSESAHPMSDADEDGTWTVTLDAGSIAPGHWGYKFLVNGTDWIFDPGNPLVKYVGDDFTVNSRVEVPDCAIPLLELESAHTDWAEKSVEVVVNVFTGIDAQPLDQQGGLYVEYRGEQLDGDWFDPALQRFVVKMGGLAQGKHSFVFHATNAKGQANPLFVPLWLEEKTFEWEDAVLYFAMTDRFMDGDPSNNAPAPCLQEGHKVNWLGGDFSGIEQKIEDGYFDNLGVSAIWISPANDNPDGCYGGDLGLNYTAYHGYFPVSLEETESRFGSLEDLRDMVDSAHDHGIRVLMDLASNHVHEESGLWTVHKDWFHQELILCGQDDNWNEHPIDCWFQPYLPDLDFRNIDAVIAFTDAAIRWARKADLDGFRVDAVKHMVHDFSRTLRYRVERELEASGVPFYLVGETFVGEWGGGFGDAEGTIKAYVSSNELTGQFDFPIYWEVLKTFARDEGGMDELGEAMAGSLGFYGPNAVMSNFLGNHDVPRFISHATGHIPDQWGNGSKEMGWNDPPDLPQSQAPFDRLKQAFAFLMTVPGVPLIYYGDEIGMPGAGDPDNRRMMQFDGLTGRQVSVRETVGALATIRAGHPATRKGEFEVLWSDDDGLAYGVSFSGDALVAVFNVVAGRDVSFSIADVPGMPQSGSLADAITGEDVMVDAGQVSVFVEQLAFRILVP